MFTLTFKCVAPTGTVAVRDVVLAADTVAFVAPKYTILFAGVVLKFVPLIVTDVPGLAIDGLTDVTVGGNSSGLFLSTEINAPPL